MTGGSCPLSCGAETDTMPQRLRALLKPISWCFSVHSFHVTQHHHPPHTHTHTSRLYFLALDLDRFLPEIHPDRGLRFVREGPAGESEG